MSSVWNLISKTKEYAPVVTQDELDRQGQGKPLQDVQRANALNDQKRSDAGWRQELEELSRRFPMATPEEAEARLDGLKASVAGTVKSYKDKIKECREQAKETFLSRLEQTHVAQRIEVLSGELADFLKAAETKLRFAEGKLANAKEFAHLRPRWLELKERAARIEKALAQIQ